MRRNYYEFFAGGGMVRAALGTENWNCVFANDFDRKKSQFYVKNWKPSNFVTKDIREVVVSDLPGRADLAWASFPCQDLSLAGGGAGLKGDRSGTYWPFWKLMEGLHLEGRGPRIIALENVCGTLTSHKGKDFAAICNNFAAADYKYGAVVINAEKFVPQSRPRLFVIGVHNDVALSAQEHCDPAPNIWHSASLVKAYDTLSQKLKSKWIWWAIPEPPRRSGRFADLIEDKPTSVQWHTSVETQKLIDLMSDVNLRKLQLAQASKKIHVGTLYRRTRTDEYGMKIQRAEIRFDEIAGCLRTPAGGSSRQTIFVVKDRTVKSRLLSSREAARLMGLPDDYELPENYNDAYHLAGDGVAVPAVEFLNKHMFEPLLRHTGGDEKVAA